VSTYTRALVTGASSGIGEAFARRLVADGTSVVAVARREDRLRALPGDVEVLVADLGTDEGVRAVEDRLAAGDIDLLVNNAGFGTTAVLADIPPERVAEEIAVDVVALARLTRAALPVLLERRTGAILNVSSVVGFAPTPKMATYAGAKAFVTAFTESLAEEVRGSGVTVSVLCPGLTRTEFQDVANDSSTANLPAFAWQSSEDVVAEALAGLAAGKVVIVPGLHNRVAVAALGVTPHGLLRRGAGLVQRLRGA
jgi:short-subunit dehydrogenase